MSPPLEYKFNAARFGWADIEAQFFESKEFLILGIFKRTLDAFTFEVADAPQTLLKNVSPAACGPIACIDKRFGTLFLLGKAPVELQAGQTLIFLEEGIKQLKGECDETLAAQIAFDRVTKDHPEGATVLALFVRRQERSLPSSPKDPLSPSAHPGEAPSTDD